MSVSEPFSVHHSPSLSVRIYGGTDGVMTSDFTCDIQACLAKNDYRQERCEHLVDRLYDCCRRHYAKHDDQIASCPDPHVLRDKMAARESAAGKTTSQQ